MKKLIVIMAAQAALLIPSIALAQEGEGGVTAEGSASASAEVSATGDANMEVAGGATSNVAAGTFGIGYDVTLSGIGGAEIVYHANDKLFVSGIIGFSQFSPDAGDSETVFAVGVGAFMSLFHAGIGDFYFGGRIVYASDDDGTNSNSQLDIEIPARVQLQLSRHFAVHFDAGLLLSLTTGDAALTHAGDSTQFTFGAGELFGLGGVVVYF
jgi:hypothetical protein